MKVIEQKDNLQNIAAVVEQKDIQQSITTIVYACSRLDGVLNNIRPFDKLSKQEQDIFKRELIMTSAKAVGYKIKSSSSRSSSIKEKG